MSAVRRVAVVGATGLVGQAVVRSLSRDGHTVVAVGRRREALDGLAGLAHVTVLAGDMGNDAQADSTARAAHTALGGLDVVLTTVNPPRQAMRLRDGGTEALRTYLDGSLFTHLRAFQAFLPLIAPGGTYVAVGGASSDFAWPDHGHISVNQAAQRMLFQVLSQESRGLPVSVREYVIAAMVHAGEGTTGVRDDTVGDDLARYLAAVGPETPAVVRFPARH